MKAFPRIIVILGVAAVSSLVLSVFLVVPVLRDVNGLNALVKEKKVELAVLDQQIRGFKTAQSDLAKATRKEDIASAVVIKEDLVVVVKELESAAIKTLTTHTIKIKEPDAKDKPVLANRPGLSEVAYDLSTLNDFDSTINFLQYLEHLPHFTELSKIILSAESTTGQDSNSESVARSGKIFGEFKGVFFIKAIVKK